MRYINFLKYIFIIFMYFSSQLSFAVNYSENTNKLQWDNACPLDAFGEFSNCYKWITQKISKLCNGLTLTGQAELEQECLKRKNSLTYKCLQNVTTLALPITLSLYFGTSTEELAIQGFSIFLCYFGFDFRECFFTLYPIQYIQTTFLDLLSNEVASKISKNIASDEHGKNITFFLVKNGIRIAIIISDHLKPTFPSAGGSELYSRNVNAFDQANYEDDTYSINLAWINKELSKDQEYVFPINDRSGVDISSRIIEWSEKNPQAKVNFWFDSNFASSNQIKQTKRFFQSYNSKCSKCLNLKDFSKLSEYRNHKELFSNESPVFFRSDLLRFIASLDFLKECAKKNCFFVYADTDVSPMTQEKLFDKNTLKNLFNNGLVMQKSDNNQEAFENSFHIISNHQPFMIQVINQFLSIVIQETSDNPEMRGPEVIYSCIPHFFQIFKNNTGSTANLIPVKKVNLPPKNGNYY